jgi:ParB/RepB/Spo0J family partition protein
MLTHKYKQLELTSISILPTRQRREINTSDLEPSISLYGVISPIVVRPRLPSDAPGTFPEASFILVAGERRYTSCRNLGLTTIPTRFAAELTPIEGEIIEAEENLKRMDLPWRDECRAIARIHTLYLDADPEWTQDDTGKTISVSNAYISRSLRVFRDLDSSRLKDAQSIGAAYNILSRLDERAVGDAMSDILEAGAGVFAKIEGQAHVVGTAKDAPQIADGISLSPAVQSPSRAAETGQLTPFFASDLSPKPAPILQPESILHESFLDWAPIYEGPRFNFIHCDFPYGINAFGGAMSGRDKWETYDDSPEVYWKLIDCLCANLDKIMTPSGHIMFWFSMEHYEATLDRFAQRAPSLSINKFPLIWGKSDNVGILPDAKRGPRRVYETAFLMSREDRLVVKPVSNIYWAPTAKEHHASTKPDPVLKHFFQLFVDEHTNMLDPTCGGGSALRAAEASGAKSTLGLEISQEHCENARKALKHFRTLRSVGGR